MKGCGFCCVSFKNPLFMERIILTENGSADNVFKSGKTDCSEFIPKVPEINGIAFKQDPCPWIPDTIMMIMIRWLNTGQHLSVRCPYRMDKSTSFICSINS